MESPPIQTMPGLVQRVIDLFRPRSFSRYLIVGGMNTAVGLVCFPLLYIPFKNVMSVSMIIVVSWALNNSIGFFLHKMITFESSVGSLFNQIWKYFSLTLFGLVTNLAIMNLVLHFYKANPIIVIYSTTFFLAIAFMLINYFGMNRVIFRRGEK